MGMGIVSDADFDKEVGNLNKTTPTPPPIPVLDGEVMPMQRPGRKEGDVNVPDSLRKIIGETSELEGRDVALELAAKFGISPASVSAYANGSTSTATMDKQPNLPHINGAKDRVAKKAMRKLMQSISHITPAKMVNAKPHELAVIARNMSAIVKEMEPEKPKNPEDDGKKGPTFVFFAPTLHKEEHYETINVRE